MKVNQLFEARQQEFFADYFPDVNDNSWSKRWKSRIILSYRPPKRTTGLDQNAVKAAYEKALAKFKELRDAHPTKLQFKSTGDAADYMKKMEYPGWTMQTQWVRENPGYGSAKNTFSVEWGKDRTGPLELEKQEYKAPMELDEIKFNDLGNGRIEVRTDAKNGPKFRIWLTALQKMPKKMKGLSGSGRDMTDYFALDRARPTRISFLGTMDEVKAAIAKGMGAGLKYDKQDHDKKQDAPARQKEAAKYSAEQQKKRKADLYAKYGKEIVDRVKIKPMSLEGDDGYQWALFVDGRRKMSGMTQYQADGEQRLMWKWLKEYEDMTPEQRLEHAQTLEGMRLYFMMDAIEKSIDAQLPQYLDAIKKNAKKFVDAKQMAKDAIETSKVSDAQAKQIFNDLMKKLGDKND